MPQNQSISKNVSEIEEKSSSITLMSVNKEKMINWLFLSLVTYCRPNKFFCSTNQRHLQEAKWIRAAEDQILISRKKNSEKYPKTLFGICKNQRELVMFFSDLSTFKI